MLRGSPAACPWLAATLPTLVLGRAALTYQHNPSSAGTISIQYNMAATEQYIGQRLSLKGQTCTVRYIGAVADKQGSWLGVEWDDTSRGKHNGTHDGLSYFTCTCTLVCVLSIVLHLILTYRQK